MQEDYNLYGLVSFCLSVKCFKDGEYNNVPDGDMIDSLEGITGEAILANDYMKEIEAGITGLNLLSD